MAGRIIIASNRLPLTIVERDGELVADRSIGGLATALSAIFDQYAPLWVGWTGVRRILSAAELKQLNLPDNLVPVQAPALLIDRYYDRFANRAIWPVLHGADYGFRATEADWMAYEDVNARFANVIQKIVQPDDYIWIHDYHLMLLPSFLRLKGIENRIGYFLHGPFPPVEKFMGLPHARELLRSLTDTDVLGLQTQDDVERFWPTYLTFKPPYPPGLVRAFPIGIDYQLYRSASGQAEVADRVESFREEIGDKHLIASVSRLDYTKGILQQLKGVEQFLLSQSNPQRFMYTLLVAPSRESLPEYQDLKQAIAAEVKRINSRIGTFRWRPIKYEYQNAGFAEMAMHYLAADTLLLTPFMDGMNLIAKEYVATRTDDKGMLVISGTMGAARQLDAAVIVNPHDTQSIANGIQKAIAMSDDEKKTRWTSMRSVVEREDVFWWTRRFVDALEQ